MTIGKKLKNRLNEDFFDLKSTVSLTPGKMIKILREKNDLSQNQLAKATGLTQPTISGLENGRITLGVERSKVLAKVLKVHPAVLVFADWKQGKVA